MRLLYTISIRLYYLVVRLASLWNKKASLWIEGRKTVFEHLEQTIKKEDRYLWMHCSSAGEFEQGKPVAEALKKSHPDHKLLISFFSPSGYGVAKTYSIADAICYMPLDTRANAERFINLVKPELAVFVKYEFWYHHLRAAAHRQVPLLLISAAFRQDQIFFKPYGGFFRQILLLFRHIFAQDKSSIQLLHEAGIQACSLAGDTRFDRVAQIQRTAAAVPAIQSFIGNRKAIVAGSTWPDDEQLLNDFLSQRKDLALVMAPHEVNSHHLQQLKALFPDALLYSEWQKKAHEDKLEVSNPSQVLIIDGVGLLSRLYQHAALTYVGGGFTRDGIHNILEAAVWEKPVVFGPNYKKYREANELIEAGGAFSISTWQELKTLADDLLSKSDYLQASGEKAKQYVEENTGATETVLRFIQEKRLLTKL